jgi:hypothetical protein
MSKKAEAYKQYEEAATLELLVSRLPDVARAPNRSAMSKTSRSSTRKARTS